MVASGAAICSAIRAKPAQLDNGPVDGKAEPFRAILEPGNDFGVGEELDRMAVIADEASVEGLLPQHIGRQGFHTMDQALIDQPCERSINLVGHDRLTGGYGPVGNVVGADRSVRPGKQVEDKRVQIFWMSPSAQSQFRAGFIERKGRGSHDQTRVGFGRPA